MTYVLDTNSFIVMGHFFPARFPTFWERFESLVTEQKVFSVREVRRELDHKATSEHLLEWISNHRHVFLLPGSEETLFVRDIFNVGHFQHLLAQRKRLRAGPVADPWVIACAKARSACVVTEEIQKPNGAKIPNVCEHFGVDCTNLEGMMEREGWEF